MKWNANFDKRFPYLPQGVTPRNWTWDQDLVLGHKLNWGFPSWNFYNFTGFEWFNMNMPNTWNYYNWKGMSPK